jgi:hypothetical protein
VASFIAVPGPPRRRLVARRLHVEMRWEADERPEPVLVRAASFRT